jgi:hypothetical protein
MGGIRAEGLGYLCEATLVLPFAVDLADNLHLTLLCASQASPAHS